MRHGTEQGVEQGPANERATFLRLRASPEAAALRHLFFAERAAARPADLRGLDLRPVRTIGVLGGGTMGGGIAAAFANVGFSVMLCERGKAELDKGLDLVRGIFDAAVRRGFSTQPDAEDRQAHVQGCIGIGGLAPCNLVIEAVFEDLDVKRAVFADLGTLCRRDAILATNTSYLDPRRIAEGLPAPGRFIGLHFFSPAQVMKLLEIIPLPDTTPDVLATDFDLARRLGKGPVRAGRKGMKTGGGWYEYAPGDRTPRPEPHRSSRRWWARRGFCPLTRFQTG